jgi:hypothetical protein
VYHPQCIGLARGYNPPGEFGRPVVAVVAVVVVALSARKVTDERASNAPAQRA